MTALPYSPTRHRPVIPSMLLLVVVAGLLFAGLQVVTHDHAIIRHGNDAEQVRKCASSNSPFMIWQKFNSDRYHCLYDMPDGRVGDQISQLEQRTGLWHEITSFIFDMGLPGVIDYLSREATLIFPK